MLGDILTLRPKVGATRNGVSLPQRAVMFLLPVREAHGTICYNVNGSLRGETNEDDGSGSSRLFPALAGLLQ
jgi:hypothetical protein